LDKQNQDFLKEKTSAAQGLLFAQGACIRLENPNGARHAHLQKPPRHHDCEQSSTFRLARELSPRSAPAGIARDRARKGPPNFAEEPFSDVPLAAVLTNWRNQNSESQQTMSALPCQ
jgi:hypothetical protein